MISAVGVVVPARNEELLLPACLDSIRDAVAAIAPIPVTVVVALDSCTDLSAQIVAERSWVSHVRTEASNVGLARRLGTEEVLTQLADVPLDEVWLAQTDADSAVPPDWLAGQVALADDGWEVVVGTVAVADWSEHHPSVRTRWAAEYDAYEHHRHVHGANLGLTAASYVAAGGWPALQAHEDVALIRSLAQRRVVATATLPVVTSARRAPRAPGGFGDTLNGLAG
jgi:glycosyltransferase involved in cell wall biosynthesis